ncbi:hypothetical protein PMIN01_03955 [Paraphaeosphaeria minitans]|uniref:Uncharacterized protein n=1 Tax=Paraphaeosphaeria minitans TaxID=565426 RepID=A0A9P6GN07_9PLEO|nr:hypothetical protein PMIN01_03955 [Paraphaeosphaeria minitans]
MFEQTIGTRGQAQPNNDALTSEAVAQAQPSNKEAHSRSHAKPRPRIPSLSPPPHPSIRAAAPHAAESSPPSSKTEHASLFAIRQPNFSPPSPHAAADI